MELIKIPAKPLSYASGLRDKESCVEYIVIHNTGNNNDTAENNGKYFATINCRPAGAHFFVDQKGTVVRSIPMNRTAYSVGGAKYAGTEAKYYGKCTNANSVSIELCDIVNKEPSETMIKSVKELIKYIQKYCPKAKTIIRHYDVNGKPCPMRYIDSKKWAALKKEMTKK